MTEDIKYFFEYHIDKLEKILTSIIAFRETYLNHG